MGNHSPNSICFSARAAILLACWVGACLFAARGFGLGVVVATVPWFPLGLFNVFRWRPDPLAFLAFGWGPYLFLTLAALAAERRALFFLFQLCLVILLVVTVGGCRSMLNDPQPFSL